MADTVYSTIDVRADDIGIIFFELMILVKYFRADDIGIIFV